MGFDVRLLPIGPLDGDRTTKPVVISVTAGVNGSLVIRVNSKKTPPSKLEEALSGELKLLAEPQAYVEAGTSVPWADVTNVIDVLKRLNAEVVLLTATPDTSSRYTQRSVSP